MSKRNPAVEVAAEIQGKGRDGIYQTSTGYWVKISPVSATLIDKVQSKIKDPEPPMVWIEEKGRSEPNPADPSYLRALQRADVDRVMAALDAIIMLGIDMCDEDGNQLEISDGPWLNKLKLLERHGHLDLDEHDMDDPLDREFLFKRYIVLSAKDIEPVASASGIKEEDVKQAEASFRGDS